MESSDPWIARLARLFHDHPAWRQAARFVDRRATSNVFFTHCPDQAWRLERRGDETLLLPGAARDPDFVFGACGDLYSSWLSWWVCRGLTGSSCHSDPRFGDAS